jgi:glycogen(starch) synthase
MRVTIFSWEYPPRVVGRLAEYVSTLAMGLAQNKVETYVVTYHDFMTGETKEPTGVTIFRVTNPVRTHIGVLTWVLTLNDEIERAAANIYYNTNRHIDLIDVYDWHFIPAAVTLKNALNIPFIYSVESIEDQRTPNPNSSFNMAIKSIEWLGFFEAREVNAKSEAMRNEIIRIYKVPPEKIKIIDPNKTSWVKDKIIHYKMIAEGAKAR